MTVKAMLPPKDTQNYANAIFVLNLLAGFILFFAVSYFYQGLPQDKSLLSLASLTAAFALGIVNRRDILQDNIYAD